MAHSTRSRKRRATQPSGEWISLAEARLLLGAASEEFIRAWVEQYGLLRGRTEPDGNLVVLKADVLRQKALEDANAAFDFGEMTEVELETLRQARGGTYPWQRGKKARPAA